MRPPVTIVASTYFPPGDAGVLRRDAFKQALESWGQHLGYEGELFLHRADDGSADPGTGLDEAMQRSFGLAHYTASRQDRRGVGASLNAGFRQAFERSPLVGYFVDDWAVVEPFDLTLWADLLMEHEDIGCVRLGPPHPNMSGAVEMFSVDAEPPANPERGGWFLRLEPYAFAFGHRPALYHRRFLQAFGWFAEDVNALECERLYAEHYAERVRARAGIRPLPEVVLALPHPWRHIASVELSALQPEGA